MKTASLFILIFIFGIIHPEDFMTQQLKYERVKNAYIEKGNYLAGILKEEKIKREELNIIIAAYKDEQLLEVFAKNNNDSEYKKILTYDVCALSGKLGPKRREGDMQIPEGFYHINRFNPLSNFHLSLGINYPNQADQIKSIAKRKGGDIFIHGSCVTIGCLPMTDDKIKEIYLLAVQARHNGQQEIPVYIFPFKMTDSKMATMITNADLDKKQNQFWSNLKLGYYQFELQKSELTVTVNSAGDYIFH